MALRISKERRPAATFRLAGRVAGAEVETLAHACGHIRAGDTIDLSEVDCADDEGVKVLEDLRRRGATLHGARPYLKLLLDGEE